MFAPTSCRSAGPWIDPAARADPDHLGIDDADISLFESQTRAGAALIA
ncbi:MAG: hypothetical protein V3V08_17495 [Nannocystaceae bacterium]